MALETVQDVGRSWDSRDCAAHGVALDMKVLFYHTFVVTTSYSIPTAPTCGFGKFAGKSQA